MSKVSNSLIQRIIIALNEIQESETKSNGNEFVNHYAEEWTLLLRDHAIRYGHVDCLNLLTKVINDLNYGVSGHVENNCNQPKRVFLQVLPTQATIPMSYPAEEEEEEEEDQVTNSTPTSPRNESEQGLTWKLVLQRIEKYKISEIEFALFQDTMSKVEIERCKENLRLLLQQLQRIRNGSINDQVKYTLDTFVLAYNIYIMKESLYLSTGKKITPATLSQKFIRIVPPSHFHDYIWYGKFVFQIMKAFPVAGLVAPEIVSASLFYKNTGLNPHVENCFDTEVLQDIRRRVLEVSSLTGVFTILKKNIDALSE